MLTWYIHFCARCGDRLKRNGAPCPGCGFDLDRKDPYDGVPALGSGGVGWSPYAADPRFAKYRSNARKWIWLIFYS